MTDLPGCACATGYYHGGSLVDPNCLTCHYRCTTCSDGTANCDTFKGLHRKSNNHTCSCENGYYDDSSSSDC